MSPISYMNVLYFPIDPYFQVTIGNLQVGLPVVIFSKSYYYPVKIQH